MQMFLIYLFAYFVILAVDAKNDCRIRLQQCENRKLLKPVCGTDNRTYSSRCAILRVRCTENSPVRIKHKGKCKDKQPCWMDQASALNRNNGKDQKSTSDYIPQCAADGTYAPVQCVTSMGSCWCVTSDGRMIPDTLQTRPRKIQCPKRGRTGTSSKDSKDHTDNPSKKGCDQTNKRIFINNFVRIFKTEYNRNVFNENEFISYPLNQTLINLDERAVQWKFNLLDMNKNNALHKNEYRDLRKLAKNFVKPRKCARLFIKLCDTDRNSIMTKYEWMSCFNVTHSESKDEEPVKSSTTESISAPESEAENEDSEQSELETADNETPLSVLEGSSLPLTDHITEDDKETDETDCNSDRKQALEEMETGNQEMFVPECKPDGRYQKTQCYQSTGYCWCVLEDSGKPIPGTSVKDAKPKCDVMPPQHQPMKGCPDHKKTTFIRNLLNFYSKNLSSQPSLENEPSTRSSFRSYEVIATLAFLNLDTNKNEMLDRSEWKVFRSLMSTSKMLKRCGRKLPRYCDSNRDNKITKNEWLQCLSIQSAISTVSVNPLVNPSNSRRRGPNPIESLLKDDD